MYNSGNMENNKFIPQSQYPGIGGISHNIFRALYRDRTSEESIAQMALEPLDRITMRTYDLRAASNLMLESLRLHNGFLFDLDYETLRPIVDTVLTKEIRQHRRRLLTYPRELLVFSYLLWSRMYLDLQDSNDLFAHMLLIELPMMYIPGTSTERMDAFEVTTIKGTNPDKEQLNILRRIAQKSYPSFGHAVYDISRIFGSEITFTIHEYKVNHKYGFEQNIRRRVGMHSQQLMSYIVRANMVDAAINKRSCDKMGWPECPRVLNGILHYAGIPKQPTNMAVENYNINLLDIVIEEYKSKYMNRIPKL